MKTFRSGDEEVLLRIGRVRLVDVVGWESSWFSDDVASEKGERGLGVFFRINESSLCCDEVQGGVDGGVVFLFFA